MDAVLTQLQVTKILQPLVRRGSSYLPRKLYPLKYISSCNDDIIVMKDSLIIQAVNELLLIPCALCATNSNKIAKNHDSSLQR